jgi:hypothetical protein
MEEADSRVSASDDTIITFLGAKALVETNAMSSSVMRKPFITTSCEEFLPLGEEFFSEATLLPSQLSFFFFFSIYFAKPL